MANTTIKIKRSYANSSPISLSDGELAYSFLSNTLWIGNTSNTPIAVTDSSARLNSVSAFIQANAAFTHPASATLQFIAPTATQWYTVGATYA